MRALLLLALGCDPLIPLDVYSSPGRDVTDYDVQPDSRTPGGVIVQGELDHEVVDTAFDWIESDTRYGVVREAVVVLLAPDWTWDQRGLFQIIPCGDNAEKTGDWCWGAVQGKANIACPPGVEFLFDCIDHEGRHLIAHTVDHCHPVFNGRAGCVE